VEVKSNALFIGLGLGFLAGAFLTKRGFVSFATSTHPDYTRLHAMLVSYRDAAKARFELALLKIAADKREAVRIIWMTAIDTWYTTMDAALVKMLQARLDYKAGTITQVQFNAALTEWQTTVKSANAALALAIRTGAAAALPPATTPPVVPPPVVPAPWPWPRPWPRPVGTLPRPRPVLPVMPVMPVLPDTHPAHDRIESVWENLAIRWQELLERIRSIFGPPV
jgi:hypothetical protein